MALHPVQKGQAVGGLILQSREDKGDQSGVHASMNEGEERGAGEMRGSEGGRREGAGEMRGSEGRRRGWKSPGGSTREETCYYK